jgi:hypothetical protein
MTAEGLKPRKLLVKADDSSGLEAVESPIKADVSSGLEAEEIARQGRQQLRA